MNDYKKSNYAINKVRKGIVYRNAYGSLLEIIFEKIAKDNPNFTVEYFEKRKRLSDELFYEEEKGDNLQSHYVKASLGGNIIGKLSTTISVEEQVILKEDGNSFVRQTQQAIDTLITSVQKKRLYLNCFRKMTVREIDKLEGTSYTVVAESIRRARNKLKIYLINF